MGVADFECVTLRNGHRAVRHLTSGEVMHPSVGPWAEAQALYVHQSGLVDKLSTNSDSRPLVVYDVGLGAAANAAAAIHATRGLTGSRRPLEIFSFERTLEPLQLALADREGFPFLEALAPALNSLVTQGVWEEPGITWRLMLGDLRETVDLPSVPANIVFHDPFSPESNPDLWTPAFLSRICRRCASDALVLTYSAATPTRVSFLLAGFFVGYGDAIGTKKETTVAAVHPNNLSRPLGLEWLGRWRRSDAPFPHGGSHSSDELWRMRVEQHPQFIALSL